MVTLCDPPAANPPDFDNEDTITFDSTPKNLKGDPGMTGEIEQKGEFFLFGAGFRNDGTASFSVQLPALCRVTDAFLYVNFYYDNNAADPSVTKITRPGGDSLTPVFSAAENKIGLSGSTCNPNDDPPPADPGTFTPPGENTSSYLRNRVYRATTSTTTLIRDFITTGGFGVGQCPINGIYTVDAKFDLDNVPPSVKETSIQGTLPGNSEPPGVRVPGCQAGQGCTLLVVIEWLEAKLKAPAIFGIVLGPKPKEDRIRKIRIYHGAVTLVPTDLQATYKDITGGDQSRFFSVTDTLTFAGQTKVGFAAGDTEDNFSKIGLVNGQILYNRAPPGGTARGRGIFNFLGEVTNPATIVPFGARQHLLSTREISGNVRNTQTALNATIVVGTDCVCWFLFVISSDETAGVASIPMNNHMIQEIFLEELAGTGEITVKGNNTIAASGLPFPGPPYFITVTNESDPENPVFEIMKVTSKEGVNQTIWKVDRGEGGTTEMPVIPENSPVNLNGTRSQMINWYGRRTNMQRNARNRRPDAGRDE